MEEEFAEEVETCFGTSCSFCERECPVNKVKKRRTMTARGKNREILGYLRGKVKISKKLLDIFYTCALCGICDARCALQNTERFIRFRKVIVSSGIENEKVKELVKIMEETGDIYGRKISTAKKYSSLSSKNDEMSILYIGCQYKDSASDVQNVAKVLKSIGIEFRIENEVCCGYVAHLMGYEETSEKMMKRIKDKYGDREVITVCPSCTLQLKRHKFNVKHILEVIYEKLDKLNFRKLNLRCTYHDPCDLGRRLGIYEEPRDILKKIDIELVEMENNREFSLCCGGGGGIMAIDRTLARDIGIERIKQADEINADAIITCCPTCELNLLRAASAYRRKYKRKIDAIGLFHLMADNIRE